MSDNKSPRGSDADRQTAPPRQGATDVLAGPIPDDIPMTGEEDPLAEVDHGDFDAVVGDFTASERARRDC